MTEALSSARKVAIPNPVSGVDLEIFSRYPNPEDAVAVVPSGVRINGQEVLIPEGAKIHISDIGSRDVVTATVTMFVRSLTIRNEHEA